MKNTLKLSVLALAIAVSFAACKGGAKSGSADSLAKADSIAKADSAAKADTSKKDTSKMKMTPDTATKKKM